MRHITENRTEEVKLLCQRVVYLNTLRVEVAKFYVVVVGAVFASSAIIQKVDLVNLLQVTSFPILLTGIGILIYDAKMRRLLAATAAGIRDRTDQAGGGNPATGPSKELLEPDFLFGFIIEVINAFVGVSFISVALFPEVVRNWKMMTCPLIVCGLIFILLIVVQTVVWYSLAKKPAPADEWPS